jgi:hypothetical protein
MAYMVTVRTLMMRMPVVVVGMRVRVVVMFVHFPCAQAPVEEGETYRDDEDAGSDVQPGI